MIDHMLVDLKKYYEGETPNYIGKTVTPPKKAIRCNASHPIEVNDWSYGIPSGKVFGMLEIGNQIYLYSDTVLLSYDKKTLSGDHGYYFALTDLIQNGGISSSLLTHVYHAFILARKELSMANNVLKILFDKDMYIRATKGNSKLVAIGDKTAIEVSEPNNAHENIEQHNPLLVYVTSYDNNYYQIVDFNGYPFYSTHTWGGETYKDDNWLKNDATYTVRKEEVLQIGGVLRRLYTKLCGAFGKQVVVC